MILELNNIAEGRSVYNQNVSLVEYYPENTPFVDAVECRAIIDRAQLEFYINIFFKLKMRLVCARCCEEFDREMMGNFFVILRPKSRKKAVEVDSDLNSVFFYYGSDQTVDLRQFVYDEIETATPMKPLCTEQCKGIIHNLDASIDIGHQSQTTEKSEKAIDPRWDALRQFKRGIMK